MQICGLPSPSARVQYKAAEAVLSILWGDWVSVGWRMQHGSLLYNLLLSAQLAQRHALMQTGNMASVCPWHHPTSALLGYNAEGEWEVWQCYQLTPLTVVKSTCQFNNKRVFSYIFTKLAYSSNSICIV